jgi:glycosyltransferase involved in cell wall biosynthesis
MNESNPFESGTFLYGEAVALRKAGAEVVVLTPHVPGAPTYETDKYGIKIVRFRYFFPENFEIIRLPNKPLYSKEKLLIRIFQLPFLLIALYYNLFKFIAKIDIIYANWTQIALLTLPFKWIFNIPIFLTYRGTDLKIFPFFLNRFIIKRMNGVLFWPLGDITKVQNSIAANYFHLPLISRINDSPHRIKTEPHKINCLFIGRLIGGYAGESKGVPILIHTFNTILQKFNNIELHILGTGPMENKLINECKRYKRTNHITFHGHQDNIFPFLVKSDLLIGGAALNAVVQEGAFCNCLLILPEDKELTGDIWKDKQNAILYKMMDSSSLTRAIEYVIRNRKQCATIADNANKTIKKYVKNIDNAGGYYLEVFQKIINSKNKSKNI